MLDSLRLVEQNPFLDDVTLVLEHRRNAKVVLHFQQDSIYLCLHTAVCDCMRFINVGVFKTGLSSFREFFQQCEIQAIDWEAIDKAEHAFETHQDVLETMESFKCLADIPACYESFHESLVRRFPNAKFFMSVRDPQR
jgi:hypothetical protein